MEILRYRSTEQEEAHGLSSSVNSEGVVGLVNRLIARVTGEEEVDTVGFVSDLWRRKLVGPPEDPST